MSEVNFTIERDLNEAQAMCKALIPYVYEDTLYGKLGGSLPSLTLGALLMRLRRLRFLRDKMSSAQLEKLAAAESQHKAVLNEWRLNYEKKLVREAISRLDAIKPYFDEWHDNARAAANAYLPEALRRTIVQEIIATLETLRVENDDLWVKQRKIDTDLRRLLRPSEFIWAQALEPVYPAEVFWWLYHKPSPDDAF